MQNKRSNRAAFFKKHSGIMTNIVIVLCLTIAAALILFLIRYAGNYKSVISSDKPGLSTNNAASGSGSDRTTTPEASGWTFPASTGTFTSTPSLTTPPVTISQMITNIFTGTPPPSKTKSPVKSYIPSLTPGPSTPVPTPIPTPIPTIQPTIDPRDYFLDNYTYKSPDMQIQIQKVQRSGVLMYVADVRIKNPSSFRSALAANDSLYGRATTSNMASKNSAIFAVNGDNCGARSNGIIIRGEKIYRDIPVREALAVYKDGHMEIINERSVTADQLLKAGVKDTYSFGPSLLDNGKAKTSFTKEELSVFNPDWGPALNPRTGIGQISPNHYILIVVDGRISESKGEDLPQFAKEFESRGCTLAYNLDGGGSSTMIFNNTLINAITGQPSERKLSDALYFIEPDIK